MSDTDRPDAYAQAKEYEHLLARSRARIAELEAERDGLKHTESVYHMNRDWIADAKVKIQALEKQLAESTAKVAELQKSPGPNGYVRKEMYKQLQSRLEQSETKLAEAIERERAIKELCEKEILEVSEKLAAASQWCSRFMSILESYHQTRTRSFTDIICEIQAEYTAWKKGRGV